MLEDTDSLDVPHLMEECHIFMSPTEGEGDILLFGADPVGIGIGVGVSVTLSCLHDIS